MKPYSCKFPAVFVLAALGLMLTGCQQAPPATTEAAPAAPAQAAPAPTSSTDSSSSRSVEVKSNPDGSAEKSVTKESNTTKQQQ